MTANAKLWVLLLLLPAAAAFAQEPQPLPVPLGARVRVSTAASGPPIEGVLVRGDRRSLTLAFPGPYPLAPPSELSVPIDPATRIQLYDGEKRYTWLGAAIGGVAIGLTGFGEPIDTSPDCSSYTSSGFCSRAEAVAISALAGALIGGVVGHFIKTERWTTPVSIFVPGPAPPVPVSPSAAVSPGAGRAGRPPFGLTVSIRF